VKKRIVYILKYSPVIYFLYHHIMSFVIRLMGLFIRTDKKLILINSFGGRKYDDSPRAIFEEMKNDPRYAGYRIVWALQDPEKADVPGEVVKSDTLSFFRIALAAGVWITNSSMERGLRFKKKATLYINTWHGSAIKKMGADIAQGNTSFGNGAKLSKEDIMLAQSQYDVDVFSRAFDIPRERFRVTGLPRNDELAHYSRDRVDSIRRKLGIPEGKKVLLYAPTYREFTKGEGKEILLRIPMDMEKWQALLGREYVILFRAHYEVAKYMKLEGYDAFIDTSAYPELADLMIVSDALITDYSSICFDYAVMHKPMYCFAYDYEEYALKRGMYLNLSEELPCAIHHDEDTLLEDILSGDAEKYKDRVIAFQEKYATFKQSDDKYKEVYIIYASADACRYDITML